MPMEVDGGSGDVRINKVLIEDGYVSVIDKKEDKEVLPATMLADYQNYGMVNGGFYNKSNRCKFYNKIVSAIC